MKGLRIKSYLDILRKFGEKILCLLYVQVGWNLYLMRKTYGVLNKKKYDRDAGGSLSIILLSMYFLRLIRSGPSARHIF